MPVCLKCGYELIFGPAGCACTQAAKREHDRKEATRVGEELVKLLTPKKGQTTIRDQREALEARKNEISHLQDLLVADWKALQRKCKHPAIRTYSSMGDLGQICDDCGYQT